MSTPDNSRRIAVITTIPASVRLFYKDQLHAWSQAGIRTAVICADAQSLYRQLPEDIQLLSVSFTRLNRPLRDLKVLVQLYRLFRRERFGLVRYSTPKGALFGSIAAFASRVPVRVYVLWGLYYAGQNGPKRWLLRLLEKLICRLSTIILPISHDMVQFAADEGLAQREKCRVVRYGSACGVDLARFDPGRWNPSRPEIRQRLDIPDNAVVIGAVARLTGDKGINELVTAFVELARLNDRIYLLLVGDQEEKDRLRPETEQVLAEHERVLTPGWQEDPAPYYAAMDIFCLPTYREGFGEVNLEAQAMGLPVVSTDVIGPRESVEHDITGFLVPPRSSDALLEPLRRLAEDPDLRATMGRKGRQRVEKMFDRRDIVRESTELMQELLQRGVQP